MEREKVFHKARSLAGFQFIKCKEGVVANLAGHLAAKAQNLVSSAAQALGEVFGAHMHKGQGRLFPSLTRPTSPFGQNPHSGLQAAELPHMVASPA